MWIDEIEKIVCPFCSIQGNFDFLHYVDSVETFKYQLICECCGLGGPTAEGLEEGTAKNNAVLEMKKFIETLGEQVNEKC